MRPVSTTIFYHYRCKLSTIVEPVHRFNFKNDFANVIFVSFVFCEYSKSEKNKTREVKMYVLIFAQLAVYFSQALGWSFEPCSEADFQGICELVEYNGCLTVVDMTWSNELSMHDTINSIRKVNGCVRLFENGHCKGRSQAYYPGAWGLQDLKRDNMGGVASSIGPCLEYECANKNFNHGEFDCVSHDTIHLGEIPNLKTVEVNNTDNPIAKYQLGYGGRVEYVLAKFKSKHLYHGVKLDHARKTYAVGLGQKGDVAGMIIGPHLGGDGTLNYNVFPQNGYIANGHYQEILERNVFAQVARNGEVWWEVNLHYDDARSTRPSALIYAVNPTFFALRHLPNPILK